MRLTRGTMILIAAGGSAALLAGAFLFQSLGWAPCKLCLWQRWPHAVAISIGLGALLVGWRTAPFLLIGALAAATSAGIAAYHTGVERKWWEGPAGCTGSGGSLTDGGSLLPGAEEAVSVPMCDVLQPFFLGLTMANWNLIASALLAVVWLMALRRD